LHVEIVQNQLSGSSQVDLPAKIGSGRGALKVDGLDSFNPDANIKIGGESGQKKKKKKCC
jgi:hypothetical protein